VELSLGLAEEMHAAEAPDEQAKLAHAFSGVAYAARQCIALEAKLVRYAERARDLAAGRAEVRRAAEREQRAGQIRLSLGRAVAVQLAGYERDGRLRDVDWLVTEGLLYDRFADAPLEDQIATLCDHLGLDPDEVADLCPFLDDSRPG
jgi:hypothetical protein